MGKYVVFFIMLGLMFSVDYESQIQPIWDANCGNCHLGNSSGGLNLSNYQNLMSNNVITSGDHITSILYDRITRDNADAGDMPPGNSELSQTQIDLIAQWIDEGALQEESNIIGCTDPNAITCEDGVDSTYFPECDDCSDEFDLFEPCDNYYNPDAVIDNGICMYNDVPLDDEIDIFLNDSSLGIVLDWIDFIPPVDVLGYTIFRCIDDDGILNQDESDYSNCSFVLGASPQDSFMGDAIFDDNALITELIIPGIGLVKYTFSVHYPNNNYWGSAYGTYYFEENILLGDVNSDGIINVIDIVNLVNYILGGTGGDIDLAAADFNEDDVINVIDIVNLVNFILS